MNKFIISTNILIFLIVAFCSVSGHAQSVSGNATTAAQDGSQPDVFSNITNATGSSDATSATVTGLDDGEVSEYLELTGFGFSIPGTDQIDGVSVTIRGLVSHNSLRINSVLLIDETSTQVGDEHASNTPIGTTINTVAFGGSTDDWGLGGSLSQTMVESANFGVAIRLGKGSNAGGERTGDIYWVEVTVYHSQASTGAFLSSQTGDWNIGTTWGGGCTVGCIAGIDFPADDYDAEINGGHTVTIPAGFDAVCEKLILNADADDTNASTLTMTDATSTLLVDANATLVAPTAQTASVTNTVTMSGGNMTVNGSLFLEADRNAPPARFWGALVDVGGGTLEVLGDISFTSDNASAISEVDLSTAGSTLIISGGFIEEGSPGLGQTLTLGADCTVEYNAAGAQNIEGQIGGSTLAYDNLTVSTSGVKTMSEDITVNGALSLQGTSTFANGGNTLTYGGTSSLEYAGIANQTAGNEMDAAGNVQTLIVNNGNNLILSSSETIDDAITLTNGNIQLGANNLTLASGGTISGYSTSQYIISDGSGYYEETTVGATVYPVGTSSYYDPVRLTPTSNASFQVSVSSGPTSPNDPDRTVQLEWQIGTGGTPGATTIALEWDRTNQEGSDFQANDGMGIVMGQFTGGEWEEQAAGYTEDSPSGRSSASSSYSTFGTPFAVGADDLSLPIELLNFEANHLGTHVRVEWVTSSEIDNDFFTIERSEDGRSWNEISILKGAGNSLIQRNYLFNDNLPLNGSSYYRLKQTDFDGKIEYFEAVLVKNPFASDNSIMLYPNPVKDRISLSGIKNEISQAVLYNASGQLVLILDFRKIEEIELQLNQILESLSPSIYLLKIESLLGTQNLKFEKQ